MEPKTFRTVGSSTALNYATKYLQGSGWVYDENAALLILPVPSFEADGTLKGGGTLQGAIKEDTVIFGGHLPPKTRMTNRCFDLLQDSMYLAQNGAITAHCALRYALDALPITLDQCPVLVLGWGRIGKCLSALLHQLGAQVTIYARKDTDRAIAGALGYRVTGTLSSAKLTDYRVIFNTVPSMLLPEGSLLPQQIKIDLASQPGIGGKDVIRARGLPDKDAPESSGKLIAETVQRLEKELFV